MMCDEVVVETVQYSHDLKMRVMYQTLINHSPDIYLDEIQHDLQEQHKIMVSLSTIWRSLKRLGITSKKVWIVLALVC